MPKPVKSQFKFVRQIVDKSLVGVKRPLCVKGNKIVGCKRKHNKGNCQGNCQKQKIPKGFKTVK